MIGNNGQKIAFMAHAARMNGDWNEQRAIRAMVLVLISMYVLDTRIVHR